MEHLLPSFLFLMAPQIFMEKYPSPIFNPYDPNLRSTENKEGPGSHKDYFTDGHMTQSEAIGLNSKTVRTVWMRMCFLVGLLMRLKSENPGRHLATKETVCPRIKSA